MPKDGNCQSEGSSPNKVWHATVGALCQPYVIRWFNMGRGRAAKERKLAMESPALVVLASEQDDRLSWLKTGQALEKMLLRARVDSVWAAFLNQPVEVSRLRAALAELPSAEVSSGSFSCPLACTRS